ncbi:MAG: glycosyltransferase family 2 protein [Candidatus Sumerlaeota bacterium]|nr:glycosyltransferase family 2 protein [Candidatus Sumerlaeota bacterium]
MAPVTAIVQTCNMAETIRECLDTLRWVDDLLVVDDHSQDGTAEICAREYGARVLTHRRDNAAAQKNWAIPQARREWVLVVDADEKATPELRAQVERIVVSDPPFDAYRVRRWNWYFGRIIRHCGWDKDRPIRLFRRACRYESKRVHADVVVTDPARLGSIEGALIHTPYRSYEAYLKTFNQYSTWAAQDLLRRGVRPTLVRTLGRPLFRFFRQYVLQRGFLDGRQGLHLCLWAAASVYAKYAKLWELTRTAETTRPRSNPERPESDEPL